LSIHTVQDAALKMAHKYRTVLLKIEYWLVNRAD